METPRRPHTRKIRLMDGGFSTALNERGFNVDEPQRICWTGDANKHRPDLVKDVYKQWLHAGVDVITTNTYHTLLPIFKIHRDAEVDDYNKPAIKMLSAALSEYKPRRRIETLSSMGCFGATRCDASEYHGSYVDAEDAFKKMMEFYANETDKLEAYGAKRIIIETVPAYREARIIQYMIELSVSTFTVCFTCKDGEHLRHGETLLSAVEELIAHPKITGVGINCTEYPYITSLLTSIKDITLGKEVFVYPNSGYNGGPNFCNLSDDELHILLKEWVSAGATVIGGCCGVGASTLKRMRKIIDTLNIEFGYVQPHPNQTPVQKQDSVVSELNRIKEEVKKEVKEEVKPDVEMEYISQVKPEVVKEPGNDKDTKAEVKTENTPK